ncbi:MAG: haloalkane dehalogenase [Wenzhouxiangellaceae bacterium]|nr:haloalkane dehalogenase [Wenzhouxiangellaceae bacterium]
MQYLRTPDERFEDLPGWNFEPRYLHVDDGEGGRLRVHFVDEGRREAPVVLLLHGEPSWSYLYRHMIGPLVDAGLRVVAPDLVGFGRSDKPARREDYTYQRHVNWLGSVVAQLELVDVTMFCQDWGGLLGLRLVAETPQRFSGVVAANTFLPTGDEPTGPALEQWREYSQRVDVFPAGEIVQRGSQRPLGEAERAAYDAPFPEETFKAGARAFPMLVPARPDDPASEANRTAWRRLSDYRRPFLTLFGEEDPITRGADLVMQDRIPGAEGQPHRRIPAAGHFLQEDVPGELVDALREFVDAPSDG